MQVSNNRIPELDGVRGIAIILVVVWHYIAAPSGFAKGTVEYYLIRGLGLCWSGVDLFFVLSGFLIVGILLDHKRATNYYVIFYARRATRILPVYYLSLLLFLISESMFSSGYSWLYDNPKPIWSYLVLCQNFFMGNGFGANWLGITWSLAIEEHFYLLVPLLVSVLGTKQLAFVFVFLIVLSPVIRMSLSTLEGLQSYVYTFARGDSLLIGGVIAIIVRNQLAVKWIRFNAKYLLAILFGMAMGTLLFLRYRTSIGGEYIHLWLGVSYGLVILVISLRLWSVRLLASKVLVWFGLRSYSIYLLHQVVSGLIYGTLYGKPPGYSSLSDGWPMILSFLVLLVISDLCYRYVERPFVAIGHRAKYSI